MNDIAGSPLAARTRGFVCLHPSYKNIVVWAEYSERGLEDELDDKLMAEGEAFLKGVQLEYAAGKAVR